METWKQELKLPTECYFSLLGFDWLDWGAPYYKAYHPAVDLGTAGNSDLGNPVIPLSHGFVEYTYTGLLINSGGYGRIVVIHYDDGTFGKYCHLHEVKVKQGQEVKDTSVIGTVGGSGYRENSFSPHLHAEYFDNEMAKTQVNHWRPWRFFPNGKSKKWVQEHYINPWDWWREHQETPIPERIQEARDWNISNKIITQGWLDGEYNETMSRAETGAALMKLDKKQHRKFLRLEREIKKLK